MRKKLSGLDFYNDEKAEMTVKYVADEYEVTWHFREVNL